MLQISSMLSRWRWQVEQSVHNNWIHGWIAQKDLIKKYDKYAKKRIFWLKKDFSKIEW